MYSAIADRAVTITMGKIRNQKTYHLTTSLFIRQPTCEEKGVGGINS
jgi:hypothetical protein